MDDEPDREVGWGRTVLVVIVALAIWTAMLTVWFNTTHEADLDGARSAFNETIEETNENFADLAEGYDELRDQLLATGEVPVAPPTADEVTDGRPAIPGPQGPPPTDEQVRAAVVAYLEANPPASGRAPSQEEIEAAVAAFCASRNGCQGPVGPPGPATQGEVGPDGPQGPSGPQGPQGPGPTQEQIDAAVESFCAANNGCIGPPGPAINTFTFRFLSNRYVCSDPDGDLNYDCAREGISP